ncbi:diacylglycerol/lipid kinase family protein [Nocardioides montaniterrae]
MSDPAPLLVVANAEAGTADDEALSAALEVLRERTDVSVARTGSPDELDDALATAGERRIVVAGGDGSMHAVVASLHASGRLDGAVLGLIPLGTGNDFARTLAIPLEPAEAAQALLDGSPRPLDLIVDDKGQVTVNSVHLGAGADAGERGARWKKRLGAIGVGRLNLGRLGYPIGAVGTAIDPPALRLRVEVDGEVVVDRDRELALVALGNGASVGGGAPLLPDADPGDGLVDVLLAEHPGALDRFALALRLPLGRHEAHRTIRTLRGREVKVSGTPFRGNSDGEIDETPSGSRSWEIVPSAYSLVVPGARDSGADGVNN